MRKTLLLVVFSLLIAGFRPMWGFFAHEKVNRQAVFTLPPAMIGFYKANLNYITESAVNPDKRRYAVAYEAPRHYLDLDHYTKTANGAPPHNWNAAERAYTNDSLQAHGILPWHILQMYQRLKDAFMVKDPELILRMSAELGHYISDAHVPLHTTENYNGQLTGQEGIHGFWESRLPEIYSQEYDFFVGQAEYISDPAETAWDIITSTHQMVGRVLGEEKKLAVQYEEKKYSFETRGNMTVKVYALEYAGEYHRVLNGMVEKQMRASIKMTGNYWYTAWVDAGQPNLQKLIGHKPTAMELQKNREALRDWKQGKFKAREHDDGERAGGISDP
jgi:hypothetical protein